MRRRVKGDKRKRKRETRGICEGGLDRGLGCSQQTRMQLYQREGEETEGGGGGGSSARSGY